MLIQSINRRRKKSCCGNCRSGKPCCGSKAKPRPAFEKRGGLWLPKREITAPSALLQHPSEEEWSGFWKPWKPLLYPSFDLSCMPCCAGGNCCDPWTYPLPNLTVTVGGDACAAGGPFTLTPYVPGSGVEDPGSVLCPIPNGGWRSDEGASISLGAGCIQIVAGGFLLCCDESSTGCNSFKLVIIDNLADGCGLGASTPAYPTSCTCDPFSLTYSIDVVDIAGDGACLCCTVGATITFTITE